MITPRTITNSMAGVTGFVLLLALALVVGGQ